MAIEAAIIFVYHDHMPDVTREHYRRLVKDNPECRVVPITMNMPSLFQDSVDVQDVPSPHLPTIANGESAWTCCDVMMWRYLLTPEHVIADRYVFVEYDTYSNGMSFREFYGPAWQGDVAGVQVIEYADRHNLKYDPVPGENWWWRFPDYLMAAETVMVRPGCSMMFSRKAAETLARFDPRSINQDMYDRHWEFRIPICARRLGFSIKSAEHRWQMLNTEGYIEHHARRTRGIWHPIKCLL